MTEVTLSLDPKVKEEAEVLFQQLGLDFSTAVGLFLRQSVREGGIPFAIRAGQEHSPPQTPGDTVCSYDELKDFFQDNMYSSSKKDLFFYEYVWKTLANHNNLPSTKEDCLYLACALVQFYQNFMKITLDEYFDGVCLFNVEDDLETRFHINLPEDEEGDEVCPFEFLRDKMNDFPLSSYLSQNFSLYPLYYHMIIPFSEAGNEVDSFDDYCKQGEKSHQKGDPMAKNEDSYEGCSPWVSGYQMVRQYF